MNFEFGKALRAARQRAGLTLAQVAQPLGLSCVYLSDIERGHRSPLKTSDILLFASLVNTDPNPLILAAAVHAGHFLVPFKVSEKHDKVGLLLMQHWTQLSEEELTQILAVLKHTTV